MTSSTVNKSGVGALTLGAIGVVYGDIGTSPLYTMKEVFAPAHGIAVSPENVIGVVSLILWCLIVKTRLVIHAFPEQFRALCVPFLECLNWRFVLERALRDAVVVDLDVIAQR